MNTIAYLGVTMSLLLISVFLNAKGIYGFNWALGFWAGVFGIMILSK